MQPSASDRRLKGHATGLQICKAIPKVVQLHLAVWCDQMFPRAEISQDDALLMNIAHHFGHPDSDTQHFADPELGQRSYVRNDWPSR